MTMVEWLNQWISLRSAGLAPRTLEQYRALTRAYIAPALGAVELHAVQPAQISALLASICDAGHSRTAQLVFVMLRASMAEAVRLGNLEKSVCDQVMRPRHFQAVTQYLEPEEMAAFASWCLTRPSAWAHAWLLAMLCGLRRGEIAGLRWRDVDFRAKEVHICNQRQAISGCGSIDLPPKSHAGVRIIPLSEPLLRLLRSEKARQASVRVAGGLPPAYVVAGRLNGPVNPHALDRALSRALSAAGCPPVTLHGLRHSMATAAVSAGVSMRVLQDLLGHASMSTTAAVYAHVLHRDRTAAIDALTSLVL